jgi:6-phospho-beta-glucosidase
MKLAIIGCGLRTPLLLHGIAHSDFADSEVGLFDTFGGRAELMAALGEVIAQGSPLRPVAHQDLSKAITGCDFVISSIRPGEMAERARDERATIDCGYAGQETTGPAGFAMAMRTVPIAVEHARIVERLAPQAWIINFTNPAGLITQAITTQTGARAIGICDTPAELFFRISLALRKSLDQVECEYAGLNHLGWVSAIRVRRSDGTREDCTDQLLKDDGLLRSLYGVDLFPPELIRRLRLIPTEYLYFYYNQRAARVHQLAAGSTRGEELVTLNGRVYRDLEKHLREGRAQDALQAYRSYLNRRNASYMSVEGEGKSAFTAPEVDWDPFEGATGYHRIAVDAIRALSSAEAKRMVLNIPNLGTISDLQSEDVIEIPCMVNRSGPRVVPGAGLTDVVRSLVMAVKRYERLTIDAALRRDRAMAQFALFSNPIVADWEFAGQCCDRLLTSNPTSIGYSQ